MLLSLALLLSHFFQQEVVRSGWLHKYRFYLINGNIKPTADGLLHLCQQLGASWQEAWQPGNTLVVDESVYEFLGESPCQMYGAPTLASSLISADISQGSRIQTA